MGQLNRRIFASALLVLFISSAVFAPRSDAGALSKLRHRWAQTNNKLFAVRSKVRQLKKSQKTAAYRLASAEKQLRVTRANLDDIQTQLRTTRGKLTKTRTELYIIRKRLEKRNNLLAARLVDNYKHGTISYANVLLGSTSFSDLVNRGYVMQKIMANDVKLINAIKDDKREIEVHKATLEVQEQKRTSLQLEQAALTRFHYQKTVERAQVLKQISSERAKYEEMLTELERNSNQIEAMIRRMERTPQGRKRLAMVYKGNFLRPVSGRVSSGFGMRFHPIVRRYKLHTGEDLASPSGTPIRAAASGVVVFAGWMTAYGNAVVIDHGGGVTTLYGHQSRLSVHSGQSVRQGQIIGAVGSTGWSTGPHLHFEVRRHGVPVRPPF